MQNEIQRLVKLKSNQLKMKTHWKKLTNPNYIGAYSMPEGKDLTVEITDVKREVVKGEGGKTDECTVLYLKDSSQ